ncbi:MAG TPA: hypothetical protein VF395_12450 [Polyangiaceae bacterium]
MPSWLGRLFVVLSLTFAAGYYVPLYRTHQSLVSEYTTLAERVTGVEQDLTKTRGEFSALTAKNQEQSSAGQKANTGGRERLQRFEGDLSTKLASRVEKRELAVGAQGDAVLVSVPGALQQVQKHWEVTAAAQSALCDVAAAVTGTPSSIVVIGDVGQAKSGPGAPSARDVAAARANAVARTLEQNCGYPSNKVLTMTRLADGSPPASSTDIALRLEMSER